MRPFQPGLGGDANEGFKWAICIQLSGRVGLAQPASANPGHYACSHAVAGTQVHKPGRGCGHYLIAVYTVSKQQPTLNNPAVGFYGLSYMYANQFNY